MRVLDLAKKDLRQLVRDWKAALFLVIMPILFTFLFGFAFGGFGGGVVDPRLPVGVIGQDHGRLGTGLLDLMTASDIIRPMVLEGKEGDPERARKKVQDEDLAALVIIPAGYSDRLLAGEPLPLALIADETAQAGSMAGAEVKAIVLRLVGAVQAARLSFGVYEAQASFADNAARQAFLEEAAARAVRSWQAPPLSVAVAESGAIVRDEGPSVARGGFAHTSPAMMVQFAIAGLMGAAAVLVLERRSGALRRLLTTPIFRAQIILGHYLAMVVMILAQLVILIAFGQLALRVDYMREPLATLLLVLGTALWTASLGLLIGVLAKTEDQVIVFSLILMFILAGMGGAWMPLEFTGPTFQAIGHLLPTAWAMDGFENIVIRGLGLGSALLPVAIMFAYAAALFVVAVWRFRFE